MSQVYPSLVNSLGSCGSTGTEVFGAGAKAANTGAGLFTLTLDQQVDSTECACIVTARGTTCAICIVEQTSDSVKTVHTFNTSATSTNAAFDYVIFQRPLS